MSTDLPTAPPPATPLQKRNLGSALGHIARWRVLLWIVGLLAASAGALVLSVYWMLRASLPQLSGELFTASLSQPVQISRDAAGVPTLTAQSRLDLAFATGVVHAQDRFFQMDLQRRSAAGELAELLGPTLLAIDRRSRLHGFRQVARQVLAQASPLERQIVDAYTAGVNFVQRAQHPAWEYSLLGSAPRPWLAEDCVLTGLALFMSLNESTGEPERGRGILRATLPPAIYSFILPVGTEWDAPLMGGVWRSAGIPGREVFDIHGAARAARRAACCDDDFDAPLAGSNAWAVAGSHTDNGHALLANDMHLQLRLPHIWYRARLKVLGDAARDLVGVTLPGLPALVAGSNGTVAWGYTNSAGDFSDVVIVETEGAPADHYWVGARAEPFTVRRESLKVHGAAPVSMEVRSTRWGPIIGADEQGRPLALAWTAHDPRASNLRLLDFETARTLEQLLDQANRVGAPVQNFVAAQNDGRIGWTLMGQVPLRSNYDSMVPASWREPGTGWIGWRAPAEYPRIIEPASGRIWTANARGLDAQTWLSFVGEGSYDLGARAGQIRDDLFALEHASARDLVAVQLDDRALFLNRWRDLLLDLLKSKAATATKDRERAQRLVKQWSGRAAIDDVGYRIVRAFRTQVSRDVFDDFAAAARQAAPQASVGPTRQFEGPLWQLVTQRPLHLLDPQFASWEQALLASLDTALAELVKECGELERCSWGQRNTLNMQHPLAAALPLVGRWLNMPEMPLPGDESMPRVQAPQFGASERLVVSPGREAEGYFQMPGGQVDHPLSPFYAKGHLEWARGEPTPLLPGPARYTLTLRPRPAVQ